MEKAERQERDIRGTTCLEGNGIRSHSSVKPRGENDSRERTSDNEGGAYEADEEASMKRKGWKKRRQRLMWLHREKKAAVRRVNEKLMERIREILKEEGQDVQMGQMAESGSGA